VTGGAINGLAEAASVPGAWVLHAGTRLALDGELVSAGGRVLDVMAMGADLASARETAYQAVSLVRLDGAHHRSDIALAAARGEIHIPGSDT
jgi:phosphoribosylamine--glycine ligase